MVEPIRIRGSQWWPPTGFYRDVAGNVRPYPLPGEAGHAHRHPPDLDLDESGPHAGHRFIRGTRWILEERGNEWRAMLDGQPVLIAEGMMAAYFALVTTHRDLLARGMDNPPPAVPAGPLTEEDLEDKFGRVKLRPAQQRFRRRVLDRYGIHCAVCGIDIPELLEAAHLKPKSQRGPDEPDNGLPFCRTHHRAFDDGLITIDAVSAILCPRADVDAPRLGITLTHITHLLESPRPDALVWRSRHPEQGPEEGAYADAGGETTIISTGPEA
jgi:HNH endonuclease